MNEPRFAAIQAQLRPSAAAEESLRRRMAAARPRRSRVRYLAAAACAALVLCAYPVYRSLTAPPLHSYVLAETSGAGRNNAMDSTTENTLNTPEDAPADTSPGPDPDPGAAGRPYEQEGTAAYQLLLAHFGGELHPAYPDWYGGAYLNGEGRLVVLTVPGSSPDLPEALENSGAVVLEDRARYSLACLRDLQEQAVDAMEALGIFAGCGVNEETNQVCLAIREVDREALAILAELDPEDDAIYVEITPRPAVLDTDTVPAEDAESPALYFADPGAPVPNEDDAIAYEPADPG